MTPPMFALHVTCLLLWTVADVTALTLSSSLRFISVSEGEPVSLECSYGDGSAVTLYWYKQSPGQKPQPLSKAYKRGKNATLFGEFMNDQRLKLEISRGKNHLKISYLDISDTGTYYCIGGSSYVYNFIEGIVIHVKSPGLNISASVHQSASGNIQPGGSVTLNCTVHTGTCDGEHSVYWFKQSPDSHPGLIYTHGGRNDQCERENNTQTHTCVYNLSMKILNLSHAGTYYCAVASCGHMLFGNGTKLDFEDNEESPVLVYFLSGALAFTTILIVLLAYTTYTMYKRNSTDPRERSSSASAPSAEGYQDVDNLHYASVRTNKANKSARQRDDSCVYSGVRV
ncbi:uncharacterized protein LOC119027874 [Acanthopagrus latus]|uniref:uncharacterized protein LOC119027874 n=1 Tax=Acanthopagrus latus TaxID=8177 RepID=UPI00187CC24E|nr:uncharacterized protein LOC119027874 [Acanthopagrus latus]